MSKGVRSLVNAGNFGARGNTATGGDEQTGHGGSSQKHPAKRRADVLNHSSHLGAVTMKGGVFCWIGNTGSGRLHLLGSKGSVH